MPTNDPALPDPKARALARGQRRYRRKVASPKQWQAIIAAKIGPCRVCGAADMNGGYFPKAQMHHIVSREDHGDDVPDNIVPLCLSCHDWVTQRRPEYGYALLKKLDDAEYAYMTERGGKDYPERAYGIRYTR